MTFEDIQREDQVERSLIVFLRTLEIIDHHEFNSALVDLSVKWTQRYKEYLK